MAVTAVCTQPLLGLLSTGLPFAQEPENLPYSSRKLPTRGHPAEHLGEAVSQPWTSPWECTGDCSPLGPVGLPCPPPGPGGRVCDRVPGSRRAPGPARRRAGASDLWPASARAERPGAPAPRPPVIASQTPLGARARSTRRKWPQTKGSGNPTQARGLGLLRPREA